MENGDDVAVLPICEILRVFHYQNQTRKGSNGVEEASTLSMCQPMSSRGSVPALSMNNPWVARSCNRLRRVVAPALWNIKDFEC